MQEPTVADMSISDEHIVVEPKTAVSSIADELSGNPRNAILVKKKGSGIIHGVVTSRDIFSKISEGANVTKMRLEKIMRTNIMTFQDIIEICVRQCPGCRSIEARLERDS